MTDVTDFDLDMGVVEVIKAKLSNIDLEQVTEKDLDSFIVWEALETRGYNLKHCSKVFDNSDHVLAYLAMARAQLLLGI